MCEDLQPSVCLGKGLVDFFSNGMFIAAFVGAEVNGLAACAHFDSGCRKYVSSADGVLFEFTGNGRSRRLRLTRWRGFGKIRSNKIAKRPGDQSDDRTQNCYSEYRSENCSNQAKHGEVHPGAVNRPPNE